MSDIQPSSHSPVRGRDLVSTGRGGAGNIHRSQSRGHGQDASSPPPVGRGASLSREPVTHVGRGGAGNFRDPSKTRDQGIDQSEFIHEHEIVEQYDGSPHRFSTGRGGAGNIKTTPDRSLSHERTNSPVVERSLSRGRALHSTGRGGAGNITEDPLQEEETDELERRAHSPSRVGELHSTGRGGLANVTALTSPPPEHLVEPEGTGPVSIGRGGAGNIHERQRSASRGGGPRSESRGRGAGESIDGQASHHHHHHHGAIGKLMDRVKGHHEHEHDHDHEHKHEHEHGAEGLEDKLRGVSLDSSVEYAPPGLVGAK